ncbi:MAG TPA: hypothetical protein PLG38_09715 [Propionibacteriaceae bacterium]|nr:hypothetical protein [Propionibacteriaceae bacterium]
MTRAARVRARHLGDAGDSFFGPNPYAAVSVPIQFLHAEWSVGADSPPAYGPEQIELVRAGGVEPVLIPGVDHAGTIMSSQGATAVAEALRAALNPADSTDLPA